MTERHPNSARFHELLKEVGELHDQKQADYGRGDDPFANVRASSDWGMPAWVGSMIRATDKVRRLQTFARKGELRNEAVEDAFLDLACYALISLVLYEDDAQGEGCKSPQPGAGRAASDCPCPPPFKYVAHCDDCPYREGFA